MRPVHPPTGGMGNLDPVAPAEEVQEARAEGEKVCDISEVLDHDDT